MKIALIAACPALSLLAGTPTADSVQFIREKDDAISSSWSLTQTRRTNEGTLSLNGNDQDMGSGVTTTTADEYEFVDTYAKVTEDGGALVISRSYESIEREVERQGIEDSEGMSFSDDGGESDLAGEEVVFTYDPEDEEWSSAFGEDSEGDGDWLPELFPRVDLASLLPADGEAPKEGDEWSLDPSFLLDVLTPGGTVHVVDSRDDDPDVPEGGIVIIVASPQDHGRWDELEGDLDATFTEIVTEDDRKLAKIVVAVDVEGEIDIIDELEDRADERGADEAYSEGTVVHSLEGEVVILWDLAGNRPHSLEGSLKGSTTMVVEWTLTAGQDEIEVSVSTEDEMEHSISATFGD